MMCTFAQGVGLEKANGRVERKKKRGRMVLENMAGLKWSRRQGEEG